MNHGSDQIEPIINQVKSLPLSKGGDEATWLADLLNVRQRIITVVDKSLDD